MFPLVEISNMVHQGHFQAFICRSYEIAFRTIHQFIKGEKFALNCNRTGTQNIRTSPFYEHEKTCSIMKFQGTLIVVIEIKDLYLEMQ